MPLPRSSLHRGRWRRFPRRVTPWAGALLTPSPSLAGLAWLALMAFLAGLVNAIAGGGSLLSFPALIATGMPMVVANVTNTVALVPGYLGAALAQRRQLRGQGGRLPLMLPAAVAGGLAGALLLLHSSERLFSSLAPWLILSGSLLLALQDPLRQWLQRRVRTQGQPHSERWATLPVFIASIYGGYFGAGLSVILLALLAISLEDNLTRLSGLKQILALASNLAAALLFLAVAPVSLLPAAVMALTSVVGGAVGGKLLGRLNPQWLRGLVVAIGVVVAILLMRRP
ncbi:MAG: sulfite exporter TauE/SafE family protein [Synechococcaceae cyanobacterium]|nr:sulfite exporter TauE/SafE family protein [Synechococcaceae cyanobacterium]